MNQKKSRRARRRRSNGFIDILNGFLSLVVLGLLVAGGVFLYGVHSFNTGGPIPEDTTFTVDRGMGLNDVANRLSAEGLIDNSYVFRFGAMAQDKARSIRAGEFNIAARSSMSDILRELTEGRPIQLGVTVPEGFTSWQVVERMNADENLTGTIDMLPLEGSILPNTYIYERGATRQSILDQMKAAMDTAVAEVWENRVEGLPISSPDELVILASIVERETGVAEERDRVAAVFINRLNRNMRLQSDPTIIYGITLGQGSLGRGLRRSEIDEPTPYNTYQIDGLPPGPIANPGIESLRAVANPADTDELYFVADGTGGHAFAHTYDEHRRNVAAWRVIERERAEAAAEAAEADAQAAMDALEEEEAQEVEEEAGEGAGGEAGVETEAELTQ